MADPPTSSPFTAQGGELHLSNQGQLELLRGMRRSGASLRTLVHGWSMTPFIRDGDVVTIAPVGAVGPRLGEMLAVELAPRSLLVIHRAVGRVNGAWLMRGDNAVAPDGVVPREQ
ncbi:MAG TPA: S24/S26 family peptidase, partial [Thermoleophilia bacterium]|nr:S24/S26 family peptidase [Thermoleophilia bacterium]